MNAQTAVPDVEDVTAPVVSDGDTGDETTHHLTCCACTDIALCGVDVSDHEYMDLDLDDPRMCAHCKRLHELDPGPVCTMCPLEVLGQIKGAP